MILMEMELMERMAMELMDKLGGSDGMSMGWVNGWIGWIGCIGLVGCIGWSGLIDRLFDECMGDGMDAWMCLMN